MLKRHLHRYHFFQKLLFESTLGINCDPLTQRFLRIGSKKVSECLSVTSLEVFFISFANYLWVPVFLLAAKTSIDELDQKKLSKLLNHIEWGEEFLLSQEPIDVRIWQMRVFFITFYSPTSKTPPFRPTHMITCDSLRTKHQLTFPCPLVLPLFVLLSMLNESFLMRKILERHFFLQQKTHWNDDCKKETFQTMHHPIEIHIF